MILIHACDKFYLLSRLTSISHVCTPDISFIQCFLSLTSVRCFYALETTFIFSSAWLHFIFSRTWNQFNLPCTWHRLHVFPRLTPGLSFPSLGIGYMFSNSWTQFLDFTMLDICWIFSRPRHWFYLFSYNFSCSCDFVELLDSAGQRIEELRGYKPLYTVRVDGNRTDLVKVRFDSDSSVRRKGFLAQYHIITCK